MCRGQSEPALRERTTAAFLQMSDWAQRQAKKLDEEGKTGKNKDGRRDVPRMRKLGSRETQAVLRATKTGTLAAGGR